MGALPPLSHWIPEDDLLLKNSLEAGASLESLAKGAVQFSRRYSVEELQDRWQALLYDTVISAEASAFMIELDRSASIPKSNRSENVKSVLLKRKSESIRSCYYAMRKRIRNDHPFESIDMKFIGGVDEPQSVDCVFVDSIRDTYGNEPSNFDVPQNEYGLDDSICASDCVTASIAPRNHDEDPLSFNAEKCVALADDHSTVEELAVCGLFEEPNFAMPGQDDDNVRNILDCGLPFHYSPQVPDWSTIEDISIPPLPDFEEVQDIHNIFTGTSNKMDDTSVNGVNVSCDKQSYPAPSTDDYLAELSKSLFSLTDEDEMLFSDPDGNEPINESYFDGLSSLLSDCPDGDKGVVSNDSNAPDQSPAIVDGAEKPVVSSSEFQMLSSALNVNPAFPEFRGGVICCTLSTEDPEVPSNDDVFLPIRMPSTSYPSMAHWKYDETSYHPLLPSVKDLSNNQNGRAVLKKKEQTSNPLPSQAEMFNRDHKVKHELPCDNNQYAERRNIKTCDNPRPTINISQGAVKEHIIKDEEGKNLSRNYTNAPPCLEKKAICSVELVKNVPVLAETSLMKTTTVSETSANNVSSDSEEILYESDDEIPCFSDVEALILDMDLSPNNQDTCSSKRVKKYQHEDSIRTTIRLEQADAASKRREIAARGAFAVLSGQRSKHFIRKPEVLLGRGTEDVQVDIDLGREIRGNKISRRQASIEMDMDGQFHLRNVGKYSIHVNGKEVLPEESLILTSGCFIEVRNFTFLFEMNQSRVKQYLDTLKRSQSQDNKA